MKKPGQRPPAEKVPADSETELPATREPGSSNAMRGFMKRFQTDPGLPKTTAGWMKLLRGGE
jgi:hypothetical protein